MKYALIGKGVMGSAIIKRDDKITVFDNNLSDVDAIIFAIKPQSFANWEEKFPNHLVISIMTGITLKELEEKTGAKKIVRSMPNLALQQGQSVTGWIASDAVTSEEKQAVKTLFSSWGQVVEMEKEDQINDLTAISGSGPAYFLYLCEHMIRVAISLGFSPDDARKMVSQTLKGASTLLEEKEGAAKELKDAITSKGGTTQAALDVFNHANLPDVISNAINAAKTRAEELCNK